MKFHRRHSKKDNVKTFPGGSRNLLSSSNRLTNEGCNPKIRGKKSKKKPRDLDEEIPGKEKGPNAIGKALTIESIISGIISYLPSKQRESSCTLVSKLWRKTVIEGKESPLVLYIDDTGFNLYDCPLACDGEHTETFRYPLHAIGHLPSWVAERTTKLVLVLKFVKKYSSKYDLDDFIFYERRPSWFLHRFHNLQDLTIFSEFASDQFVSILSPPSDPTFRQHRLTFGIPSLKRIQFEETNVSNWRNSFLKRFVELAPNLEILQVRENMRWKWNNKSVFFHAEDIFDLLPLSGSLKELVLFSRPNLQGNFEAFLAKMPLLDHWDISTNSKMLDMGNVPITSFGRNPMTFEDNAYRCFNLNEHPHFTLYVKDEAEFLLTMQEILVPWFLRQNDVNIHPWKDKITHMVGYLDTVMKEYFESSNTRFFEHRPPRPYRLPKLAHLLEVDTAMVKTNGFMVYGRTLGNYCCASRNKTKLKNYRRVVRPCMELYYDEFLYFCDLETLGITAYPLHESNQRRKLNRLIKRITRVEDRYHKGFLFWFGKASKNTDFRTLV